MNTPYLILHRVRGLPAFDIATRCDDMGTDSDPGPWWIIPTSGHRAYPNQTWPLEQMMIDAATWEDGSMIIKDAMSSAIANVPSDWPDHYSVNDRQTKAEPKTSLISLLGLSKKIIRRI